MLEQLEREAVADLQLELAALVAERMEMHEQRAAESLARWGALLRTVKDGGAADAALEAAAAAEDAGAQAARERLFQNQSELVAARDALAGGMPSDERSQLVGLHWENAVLRAEVHACRQSLEQARRRAERPRAATPTSAAARNSVAL